MRFGPRPIAIDQGDLAGGNPAGPNPVDGLGGEFTEPENLLCFFACHVSVEHHGESLLSSHLLPRAYASLGRA